MIAPTKKIDAIGSGIPCEDMYSTVFAKPVILPGIADINIDEMATLAKKSKKMYTILIKSDNALHAIVSVLGLSSPNVFFFLVGTTTATHYRILTIKHVE